MSVGLNQWDQLECHHCRGLGGIFAEERRYRQRLPTARSFTSGLVKHHGNFRELDHCALELKCIACQVFRRAILLELPCKADENALTADSPARQIGVCLQRVDDLKWLEISISVDSERLQAIVVTSDLNTSRRYPALRSREELDPRRIDRLKEWISKCHTTHLCSNYTFSRCNPTWLLRILPGKQIQLVSGSDSNEDTDLLKYVALSYRWGVSSATRTVQIEHRDGNEGNEKSQPFSVRSLPSTLQDAIAIVHGLGVEFIWIDSLCVPKGTWHVEASKMHEVYGNAYFTLSASGVSTASDRMLSNSSAWRDEGRGCRLHGPWIYNVDTPLDDIRTRAPVATRGWILQEERLSPRILYWCTQRAYWSCHEVQRIEAKQPGGLWKHENARSDRPLSHPQYFMKLCRAGDPDKLPAEWADLVSAFTRRHFVDFDVVENRFAAFSGLAMRYLLATSTATTKNEYLAGIWRDSVVQNLSWEVETSMNPERSLHPEVPSWSWLSLPLGTKMQMPIQIEPSTNFCLQKLSDDITDLSDVEIISRGARIQSLTITSRLRLFVEASDAIKVPWDGIQQEPPLKGFDFSLNPAQAMFSRNQNGQVLSYEAHQEEVIGQLDYSDAEVDDSGESRSPLWIPEGSERDLYCLETGLRTMLLLQCVGPGQKTFMRVGVCREHRSNFFGGARLEEIALV